MERVLYIQKKIRIYAYDVDAMGIVSNISYVRWFEDLRTLFLDKYYPLDEMLRNNKSPILSQTQVRYHFPLTIHDRPTGHFWVTKLGRASWEAAFEISTSEQVFCTGNQKGSFIDLKTRRPIRVPEKLMEAYQKEINRVKSA